MKKQILFRKITYKKIGVVKGAENKQKVKMCDFGGFWVVFMGLNPLQPNPLKKI